MQSINAYYSCLPRFSDAHTVCPYVPPVAREIGIQNENWHSESIGEHPEA
jgi:hypothetical protein